MASSNYTTRILRDLRRNYTSSVSEEISGLVDECRLDMVRLGILQTKAADEADSLIYGAVRDFCKWRYGLGNPDADRYMAMYQSRVNEMRYSEGYYAEVT